MEPSFACKSSIVPKYVREIEAYVCDKLRFIKKTHSELTETKKLYFDEVLEVYRDAFKKLMSKTITYASLLKGVQNSYEQSIQIRDEQIKELITQDKVFGVSTSKNEQQERMKLVLDENDKYKELNAKLASQLSKVKTELGKLQDEKFSEFLCLMKERDARYTLYFENVKLHLKLKELDGSGQLVDQVCGDPVVLRIALDRCREQLSVTQKELKKMKEEYEETVPRRQHEALETRHCDVIRALENITEQYQALEDKFHKLTAQKASVDEELLEVKERCIELSRCGTPRPAWELCADFIGGGRDRWRQLAAGRSSRDALRVLLRELGPAAHTDILEYFEGLGLDPSIPPYLRYEGKVRNLRLSRREIAVIINDIWISKINNEPNMTMQDYVTKYFEDRYLQPSVRAEWAYNLCSGAEQMMDEPHVKLFWGVLHGQLSENIYTAHRDVWHRLKENLYSKGHENITLEEFEKIARSTFPLKNEVDIKNLTDVVRKQLKLKITQNEVNLDKLLKENEEGFDRLELSRELYRQRQLAQDKYIRELLAELGARQRGKAVGVDQLKRAFAIVDPAIDHIRMEKNVRWVFSCPLGELSALAPLPLRTVGSRLAAADVPRVGPRHRTRHRRPHH